MNPLPFQIGDLVYAAEDIFNDGGMPGIEDEEGLIAPRGCRGVIVQEGHAEADENQQIFLVCFETGPDGELGDPVGCLPEELTQEPLPAQPQALPQGA